MGGSGGGKSPFPVPQGEVVSDRPFRIIGNLIIAATPADTIRFCIGDSLWTLPFDAHDDTLRFRLRGDSLTLMRTPWRPDPGSEVQALEVLIRVAGDTGLEGVWLSRGMRIDTLSGSVADTARPYLDRIGARMIADLEYKTIHSRFLSGRFAIYTDADRARAYVDEWNGSHPESDTAETPDSAIYAMAIRAVGKSEVELKGLVTGETVTLTLHGDRSVDYRSDDKFHDPFSERVYGGSCPDKPSLPWYVEFLSDNWRPAPAPGRTH